MGRYLVPATMALSMLAFAVAALATGMTPYQPGWWRGAVALAILGGITPMIYAVNIRILPVFARRNWPSLPWLRAQMGAAIAGAWLIFAGVVTRQDAIVAAGNALALAGDLLFIANLGRLFRQPVKLPAPPLPYPEQAQADRVGVLFMRLSALYLVLGLGIGVALTLWQPSMGRWDLVWAHTLLVGFFLSMVSGVCYHVLTRWTTARWKAIWPLRLHVWLVAIGLPLMLLALATGESLLFAIAGPLQAAAVGLFLLNIAPLVPALPGLTRPAFIGAMLMLLTGITLGALFAIDPALGARLRLTHAEINLFGWTGLLICGVGYYLAPRFAGRPLRWPRLAPVQLWMLAAGIVLGVAALVWRVYAGGPAALVLASQLLVAASYLLFGILVAGTFFARRKQAGTVASLQLGARPTIGAGQR
jgi:hypothetical protein